MNKDRRKLWKQQERVVPKNSINIFWLALAKIRIHAHSDPKNEVCGILVKKEDQIVDSIPCENIALYTGGSYIIDPLELIDKIFEIEKSEKEVAGFYHSHPFGSSTPSGIDEIGRAHV